ncbi:receptor-like serine/threonine-protein kinase ALE2 [Cinnamomum micranthum f. kanehirae]|uniref:Receptor-like serine/threonine-protein kinase ALE2 n=1 Tax=Cinnamomum micranthum f. kanehirae TaxID=337451 RepID=A0A3S3MQY1_9MAGN|nr:receptor-like serine/threonine-protein kinase ALE2 [Cinnamomum micranthum f. kanehirae]
MGQLAITFLVFFLGIVCSVFHRSEGSIAYPRWVFPLAASNMPPSTDRTVLPVASEALSVDVEHRLSRVTTPSMLAPNQLPERYAQSPSSSSVLAPIGGRSPSFRFHGTSPTSSAPRPISLPRGYAQSPSTPSVLSPTPNFEFHGISPMSNAPRSTSHPRGSVLPVPTGLPPRMGFIPPTIQGPIAAVPAKSSSHHTSKERRHSKGLSPSTENHTSHLPIGAAVPIASPSRKLPLLAPAMPPRISRTTPVITSGPSVLPIPPPLSFNGNRFGFPSAAPPVEIFHRSPSNSSPTKGYFPVTSPAPQKALKSPSIASPEHIPSPKTPVTRRVHSPAPSSIFFRKHHARKGASIPSSAPLNPSPSYHQGSIIPPSHSHPPAVLPKKSGQGRPGPPPMNQGPSLSPMQSPLSPAVNQGLPAPSPSSTVPSTPTERAPSPSSAIPFTPTERAPSPSSVIPFTPTERAPSPSSVIPSTPTERAPSPSSVIPSTPTESAPSPSSPIPLTPTESEPSPSSPIPSTPTERAPSPLSAIPFTPTERAPSPSSPIPFTPTERAPSPSSAIPSTPAERAPSPSSSIPFTPTERAPSPSSVFPFSPTERAPSPSPAIPSTTESAPSPLLTFPSRPTESAPSPSFMVPSKPTQRHAPSPSISPAGSSPWKAEKPVASPVRALPPPPPNKECTPLTCMEPYTNTPPGSPCYCVLPIQVGLSLSVALFTFFPLVSELAQEIATGVFMEQSQVRIMGADAANQDPDKTIVLIDLVPLGEKFDNTTAFLTYEKFWHKQVVIKPSFFGDYEVLYVKYPGLPPSPSSVPSSINAGEGQLPNDNNSRTMHPLGVDVRKKKGRLGSKLITVIVVSSCIALVLFVGAMWLLLWKRGLRTHQPLPIPRVSLPPPKPSGAGSMILGSCPSSAASASLSFSSSIAAYTGSAKTFSIGEIEKATNNFDAVTILGEGGFGLVYRGTLEDGTKVAVKLLKRDDQQGSREFLAEVEMLSRLHHRNLVKLIGICTEEHCRCLVYELIPNGSVDSHLHGCCHHFDHLDQKSRYVAPEYAMTGHLLVKSDVYSYGVVLLELLTGRKPVDMSRPLGQENLVTWARPLLTSKEGLEMIVDPALGPNFPFDSVAKVAAIASMCVQVEVSHRPFMGEVVQALKLVCNESDEKKTESGSCSLENSSARDAEIQASNASGQLPEARSFLTADYDSGLEAERALSTSEIFATTARFTRQESGSSRRHSSSGPLRTGRNGQFSQRSMSTGSASEHGVALRLWEVLDSMERWP